MQTHVRPHKILQIGVKGSYNEVHAHDEPDPNNCNGMKTHTPLGIGLSPLEISTIGVEITQRRMTPMLMPNSVIEMV